MINRIGLGVVALTATLALVAPANAASPRLHHAERVARASTMSSIWHEPRQGYVTQDRTATTTLVIPPRHQAMSACPDHQCRVVVWAYYTRLGHQWRVLNRNLWILADALHLRHASSEVLLIYGRRFTANQRSVFA